jgi:hypothetical protein
MSWVYRSCFVLSIAIISFKIEAWVYELMIVAMLEKCGDDEVGVLWPCKLRVVEQVLVA